MPSEGTNVCWRASQPQSTQSGGHRPYICCVAIRIARLGFVGAAFDLRGIAEWLARVDPALNAGEFIGDWRFCPSEFFLSPELRGGARKGCSGQPTLRTSQRLPKGS